MATLYVRDFDDDLKNWLKEQAKAEGFTNLSEYLRVHFKRLKNEDIWDVYKINEVELI